MSLNGPVNDSSPDPDRPDSSHGLILVIDDNPHIQRLIVTLLAMHGHRATAASSMEEAFLMCQSQAQAISLAIVDCSLCMGQHIGELGKLKILAPHLKIIVTSGMLEDECCPKVDDCPYDLFLPKPFHPADLIQAIQQVLPAHRP